ncbi:autotransporter-associated beta strand repeat-containing protein [Haloferula rosea]|uniref:Autotransporter-associated beta strand repeat-containing protein n=1 Tax=Haloferula rosea TaxID=490093 RepID=A0A934VGI6_9BACT|nr:autotransporter-associated beta strand repeat-containing protein [Haloferula rosea]MBK1828077.1 autotransporter-associated beta strand repeat-containing protein [Haloferula rosea]
MMNEKTASLWLSMGLLIASAQAATITWNNNSGDNEFSNPANWVGGSFPASESMVVDLTGTNRAIVSTGTTLSSDQILIGYNGTDGEFEQTGGTLTSTSNPSAASRVGRNGETGTWTMSGGRADINGIQLGLGGGTGNLIVKGGHLNISRGPAGASLHVDYGGTGNFEISGGSLITRTGVRVGDQGTFSVIGHGASRIGIGTSGPLDGEWYQEAGGTLRARVNATSTGLSTIFIDEVDTSDGSGGNVTFEDGALLDVGFTGGFVNGGTYTVMEWEGSVTDLGLEFAPGVDTNVWSFNVDPVNKKLTVTATGAPFIDNTVTVSSIAELIQYAGEDNFNVTMTPGTYWLTGPAQSPAPVSPDQWEFLEFSGDQSTFDLTGVTIKVDTQELSYYGGTNLNVVEISGDGVVLEGLNLQMVNVTMNGVDAFGDPRQWTAGRGAQVVRVIGSDTQIRNCEFTSGGSYPYGYGDAFGKGARPTDGNGVTNAAFISHKKQSGFLITGGANNVLVDNVTLHMRSYGHGFFMQQGASDISFIDCDVLGDTMADSDDIIAHPEYQVWQAATYKVPIPADINISKHEGAFRVYGNSDHLTNGFPEFIENITITNCRAERMRVGIACADAIGFLRVTDTELVECEYGFAPSGYGTESTFTGCKGDALNGPLIYFQRGVDYPANMEIELTGTTPGKGIWPIALISGDGSNITLTSSASPGVYPEGAYINLSQKWREWRHRPAPDLDELGGGYSETTTNTTIHNLTEYPLLIGPNATGNTITSNGGVINKSTGNTYTGATLVPANITIQDTWTSPPNAMNVPWAQFDGGGNQILPTAPHEIFSGLHFVDDLDDVGGSYGTGSAITVLNGGTLELDGGMQLQGGTITLEGTGTNGQGAAYSDGQTNNGTRMGSSSSSITNLTGDTSIGVGIAGNELLIGPIAGVGSLTKTGPGRLAMEQFIGNTFTGALIVAEGEVRTRSGKARNDLTIAAGATFSQIGNLGLNQDPNEVTVVDGTLNLNDRGVADGGAYSVDIGTLSGAASGQITATSTAVTHTVNVMGDTSDGTFAGSIGGTLRVVKTGNTTLTLSGINTYSKDTIVNEGTLVLADGGELRFQPLADGLTNQITGSGSGTVQLDGTLHLDLSGANTTHGNRWQIVDAANLSEAYGGTFSVNSSLGSFSHSGGKWTLDDGSNLWAFSEFDGTLTVGDNASSFANWASLTGATNDPNANDDTDGLNNLLEFAFGTNPIISDSVPLDPSTPSAGTPALSVTFSPLNFVAQHVRRKDGAINYTVQFSNDLLTWEDSIQSPAGVVDLDADYEIVEVNYPIVLSNFKKARFFRVKVTQN